jgi:hypothetical protein
VGGKVESRVLGLGGRLFVVDPFPVHDLKQTGFDFLEVVCLGAGYHHLKGSQSGHYTSKEGFHIPMLLLWLGRAIGF